MPVIAAYADHPTRPYVRVEVDWADTPSVQYARVVRIDQDGNCTALRPYICYFGDYLLLSCGVGVFWDTEAPLDGTYYYVTEGLDAPCLPAAALLEDAFGRTVSPGWGSPDIGEPYVHFGTATAFSVNGSAGLHSHPSANSGRISVSDIGTPNARLRGSFSIPALASGVALVAYLVGRFTDDNNYYMARIGWTTGNTITLTLRKRVAGVETNLTSITIDPLVATINTKYFVDFSFSGDQLAAKLWQISDPEPSDWQTTATDTDLTSGTSAGVRTVVDVGSGNAFPFIYSMDDLLATDPCEPCEPVTATSETVTLANDGRAWLKDPVRPCHDQPVPLCPTGAPTMPVCGGPGGILFIGMGPEIYASNSYSLRPQNRRRNIAVTRPRSDATSALRLQTMTFDNRDEVLVLTAPGSPLLFQAPPEYGLPDRYMDVKAHQVESVLPDLRVQVRTHTLPYDTVDRPAGPTQGICGARVADMCDLYPTWGDLAATGLTWGDLVAGQASPVSASPSRRTWDDVDAEFADWDAVAADGRTWQGLEAGD